MNANRSFPPGWLAMALLYACAPAPTSAPQSTRPPAPAPTATETPMPAPTNPFFQKTFGTLDEAPPFDRIVAAHFAPAFDEGMRRHDEEMAAIAKNPEPPTFANTIEALDRAGALLGLVERVFSNRTSAHTDKDVQAIDEAYAPKLSTHRDAILQNARLFARIKALYDQKTTLSLNTEKAKLLADTYRQFVRGGAELGDADKAKVTALNARLAVLYTAFGNHVREEEEAYALLISDEKDLAGLPAELIAAAADTAKKRGAAGKWAFTLVRSSIEPFLQYAQNRDLRRDIYQAYIRRGASDNKSDNRALVKEIVVLRAERAQLLGYHTFADYVIADNMAKTPKAVSQLLERLWKAALGQAKRERTELSALLRKDLGKSAKLEPWDWRYYAEKVRKARYDVSEDELKPYFQLDQVRDAAFDTATRLFGITFKEVTGKAPLYHPDVKVFEVTSKSDGALVGLYYVDYFARDGKRGGAWMNNFRNQYHRDGRVRPIVVNVGNFPPPVGDKPSLLAWNEVETLFHEFGHGLHGLLSDVTYENQSGTNVKRDYVEMPSQLLENWASEPDVMKRYGRHYQTGEPIPDALVEKLHKAATFNQGFIMTELVAAALLDMKWHSLTPDEAKKIQDVESFDRATMAEIGLIPEIAPRYHSPYFQHIFSDEGYAAGYYVYLWAQVLEADAFTAFSDAKNAFDPNVAGKLLRYIFAKGGADDEMTMYRAFRGREPSVEPLLKKLGLRTP